MRIKPVSAVAGALLIAAGAWADGDRELQKTTGQAVRVTPMRAMGIVMNADGTVTRTTGWIELSPDDGPNQASDLELFDAFENDEGDPGSPTDACCGMGGSRWYFGETYCNTFAVADMQAEQDGPALRVEFAWFWYVNGPGSNEQCFIAVFTGDFFESNCGNDPPYNIGPGIVYDFGVLDSSAGQGYYFADINLDGTGLQHDVFTNGSYAVIEANQFDGKNLQMATCGQSMLWGESSLDGCKDLAGDHGNIEYDDDNPRDGFHDIVNECYDYAFGLCPDPLTAMVGFGIGFSGPPCTGEERIKKVKCKARRGLNKLKVKVVGGNAGEPFCVSIPRHDENCGNLNDRGKGKVKYDAGEIVEGSGDLSVFWECGAEDTLTYECSGSTCTGTLSAGYSGTDLTASVSGAPAGKTVIFCYDDGNCVTKTTDDAGNASQTWNDVTGSHVVSMMVICDDDNAVVEETIAQSADAADDVKRCDRCRAVADTFNECLHFGLRDACQVDRCINNVMNTASCRLNHGKANADCDTKIIRGPEIVQNLRVTENCRSAVGWHVWKTLYYGCGNVCLPMTWWVRCDTETCDGRLVRSANRGRKKKCGC